MAAMELPPRKTGRNQEVTIQRNRSSLDVLMQMGFPKHRGERALAATGDKGVQLASDWLLSHVNDPSLDDRSQRDYILYLCPVGQLQQQLLDFWHRSYALCGWNRAHNYFPHITLCSFFKAEDSAATPLAHLLRLFAEKLSAVPPSVSLEYFSSTNFIGLFMSESCAAFFKQVTAEFAEEAKKLGVTVEPHKKQLHISLSYQFPTEMKEKLEEIAKEIKIHASVRWDIRLYSRDPQFAKCQVRQVLYTHSPRTGDELELIDGDFIYMDEAEMQASPDGWYKGTSWLTGLTGMFPGNYTQRTAGSETWTLHRSIPIIGSDVIPLRLAEGAGSSPVQTRPASTSPTHHQNAGIRVIEASRKNRAFETSLLRGTETLPARLPEMTTIRSVEMNGPLTAQNILYSTVGEQVTLVTQPVQGAQTGVKMSGQPGSHTPQGTSGAHSSQTSANPPMLVPQSQTLLKTANTGQSIGSGGMSQNAMSGHMTTPHSSPATSYTSQSAAHVTQTPGHERKSSNQTVSTSSSTATTTTPTDSPRPTRHKMTSPKKVQRVNPTITAETLKHNRSSENFHIVSPAPATVCPVNDIPRGINDSPPGVSEFTRHIRPPGPRQLYVIRHGERVDFTFGKEWIQQSFDQAGNYIRHDLNMPRCLPKRKGGPSDFRHDSPLTVQGHFQAKIIGEALKEKDVPISYVYASPSLRCVQTATSLLEGMGIDREIHLEAGLFEWLGWYQSGMPRLMTISEFRENGFRVSTSNTQICPTSKFNMAETTEQYYDRCHTVTKEILKRHELHGGNVLVIAHAASLDCCTRQLLGHPPRNHMDFHDILHKIPYVAMSVCQEDVDISNKWSLIEPPILAFAHTNNPKYNWSVLTVPYMV